MIKEGEKWAEEVSKPHVTRFNTAEKYYKYFDVDCILQIDFYSYKGMPQHGQTNQSLRIIFI